MRKAKNREKFIHVRISSLEHVALGKLAESKGLSMSECIRCLLGEATLGMLLDEDKVPA